MDRDRLRGQQLPAHRPGLPPDRRHAARPARARERGRPGREPAGGRHPASRTLEGCRRQARPGRGGLPGREPVPGARRGRGRPAGRLACGPARLQTRGRPHRCSGSAAAHARRGRGCPRRRARGGARVDPRSGDPCGTDKHGQRARRRTSPAEAAGVADPAVKEAARASAGRTAPGRPAATGGRPQRPRRAVLSAASIAVPVMGLVAALAVHAGVDRKFARFGPSGGLVNPEVPRAEQVLTAITISLVILAVLTAIFTASATVLDARRASAVTLALGATPRQVRAGLAMTQVIPALPGAIIGVPLGLGLFKVAGHGLSGLPPVLWLVASVLGTVVVVAALTSIPARIVLRRPVAEMLQTEAT